MHKKIIHLEQIEVIRPHQKQEPLKEKFINWTMSKLKMLSLQETPLKGIKSKLWIGGKYL